MKTVVKIYTTILINIEICRMFYKQDIPYVKATNEVCLDRSLVESDMSNFMNGFRSMESVAEAYNDTTQRISREKNPQLEIILMQK